MCGGLVLLLCQSRLLGPVKQAIFQKSKRIFCDLDKHDDIHTRTQTQNTHVCMLSMSTFFLINYLLMILHRLRSTYTLHLYFSNVAGRFALRLSQPSLLCGAAVVVARSWTQRRQNCLARTAPGPLALLFSSGGAIVNHHAF